MASILFNIPRAFARGSVASLHSHRSIPFVRFLSRRPIPLGFPNKPRVLLAETLLSQTLLRKTNNFRVEIAKSAPSMQPGRYSSLSFLDVE
ncbi:hypothetical protein NXS19_012525 [Fusarium pseudograminearum]|nr:hypothetical protein NXS19_012525 [Fusarium pseudograminearum]